MPFITRSGDVVQHKLDDINYKHITQEQATQIAKHHTEADQKIQTLQNIHKGAEIHILGTGPSLEKYKNTGEITIGVNGSPVIYPNLSYWLTCDDFLSDTRPLNLWIRHWLETYPKCKTLVRRGILSNPSTVPHDFIFRHADEPSSVIRGGLCYAMSSVVAAIDLARHMGAGKIVLVGVDYHDRSHAYTGKIHNDPLDNPGEGWAKFQLIQKDFERIYAACKAKKIEVVNSNPDSALTVIPRVAPTDTSHNDTILALQKMLNETQAKLYAAEALESGTAPSDGVLIDAKQKIVEYRDGGTMNVFSFEEIEALKGGKNFLKIVAAMTPLLVPTKTITEGSADGTVNSQ